MLYRALFSTLLVLTALALLESALETRDRHRLVPPGTIVRVGTRRVHVNVTGAGRPGPTVILECGIGGATLVDWAWVQRGVEAFAPVFSYDRAGMGWSDPAPAPRDGERLVRELHATLAAAGVRPPYVFVGHSFGGLLARLYTDHYPDEVTGVAMLEASHPRLFARLGHARTVSAIGALLPAAPWVARLGVMRWVLPFIPMDADLLPPRERAIKRALMSSAQHWDGFVGEMESWRDRTSPEAARTRDFGDRPLAVVSAGAHALARSTRLALQVEQAQLSTNAFYAVEPGATHAGLILDPGHAAHVVSAIRAVWDAARTGARVVAPPGFAPAR